MIIDYRPDKDARRGVVEIEIVHDVTAKTPASIVTNFDLSVERTFAVAAADGSGGWHAFAPRSTALDVEQGTATLQ